MNVEIQSRGRRLPRVAFVYALFLLVAVIIAARLVQLQVYGHKAYSKEAEGNTTRTIPQPLVRCDIVDRNGIVLATDRPELRAVRITGGGDLEITPLTFERASELLEAGMLPRGYVEAAPMRHYPAGATASHLLGYLGEIDRGEYKKLRNVGYRYGDRVGKAGIERQHETRLRGERGARVVRTDARGRLLPESTLDCSRKGRPLELTIDMRLQEAAVAALGGRRGGVVFMEPHTGAVRVMVSTPGFDPEALSRRITSEEWKALVEHPDHPLLNRAVSCTVPPASIFKLVVAAAALEEGIVAPDSKFFCGGYYRLGNRVFRCWRERGHGRLDFEHAISDSCDVVFYQLGRALGIETIRKYAKMFGLGGKTGIDMPGEAIGLFPDPEWKRHFRGDGWYEGDTVNVSIGQGYVQATPVQAAVMVNVIAAGGWLEQPHFVGEASVRRRKLPLKRSTVEFLRKAMRLAVTEGTAVGLRRLPIMAAGKTGTAEDPPREEPHAWFVGFAPADEPVLSWAVFVENAGFGASVALPVARSVLEKAVDLGYFPSVVAARNGGRQDVAVQSD
ncbi:MAG: penicillin-binding protein 2 [bacterium]